MPLCGKGVERGGKGRDGNKGRGGRGRGALRGKWVERGGEEGKGRRKGEGSAITGTNRYCLTLTDPRGGIILNK